MARIATFYGPSERQVEIPWLLTHLGSPRRLLDIGSAGGMYLDGLAATGAQVWLNDTHYFEAPEGCNVFIGSAGDLPANWEDLFDLVTCISTLDHVGLEAYGNQAEPGLLKKVALELHRVTAPRGRLLVTVPFGMDCVTSHPGGGQRVFSWNALMDLFPEGRRWEWMSDPVWKLDGGAYVEVDPWMAAGEPYAGDRAGACIALELRKIDGRPA